MLYFDAGKSLGRSEQSPDLRDGLHDQLPPSAWTKNNYIHIANGMQKCVKRESISGSVIVVNTQLCSHRFILLVTLPNLFVMFRLKKSP